MTFNPASWLPHMLGPIFFQLNGVEEEVERRGTLNFIGDITIEDDPENDRTNITFSGAGGGSVATTHGDAPQSASEVDTSNATATAIGSPVTLASDTVTTIDCAIQCIQAGAAKCKIFSVRRSFLNDGGSVTDGTLQTLIAPEELGGSLGCSVDITRSGTTVQPKVTGVLGVGLRWYLLSQSMKVSAAAAAAAPTVTDVTPDNGSAGTSITITGTGFVDGDIGVTVDGNPCTSIAWVSSTELTADVPSGTAGAKDVVVTNPDGQSGTLAGAFTYSSSIPDSLAISGWWRADYAGVPWAGRASAGLSSGRDLTDPGGSWSPATTGTPQNALTPAAFNGTDEQVINTLTPDNFVAVDSLSIIVLFKATSAAASGGLEFQNPGLVVSGGGSIASFGLTFHAGGVSYYNYDVGGGAWPAVTVACGTGAYHLAQAKFDGVTQSLRVDSGGWSTNAAGPMDAGGLSTDNPLRVGTSYDHTKFFEGEILEVIVSDQVFSDADTDAIKAYINARYGLAL